MPFWTRKSQPFADCKIRRTAADTRTRLRSLTGVTPDLVDGNFVPVSRAWFDDPATQRKLRTHFWGLPRYTSDAWDCDNFAVELVQWLCKEAALAGVDACPMVYVHCVHNRVPWAGVRDGYHALNLIEFDDGTAEEVIEPQSIRNGMARAAVADYPNRAFKIYH